MLMAPRGFPFKRFLGLKGYLRSWMGLVHEEAFPCISKVNSKSKDDFVVAADDPISSSGDEFDD
jgi:hypothetical protein